MEISRCSVCQKDIGTIFCTGCNAYFCMKDLKGHRENLSSELDGIIQERDEFQDKISKVTQQPNSSNPLILQITEWQTNMIKKVDQMAEQARKYAIELLDSKRMQITTDFKNFSQELVERKESENFVEHDLVRLKQMIRQFDQELKQLSDASTIELHTENSDHIEWEGLIYIEAKPNNTIYQQREQPRQQLNPPASQRTLRNNDSF